MNRFKENFDFDFFFEMEYVHNSEVNQNCQNSNPDHKTPQPILTPKVIIEK